MVPATNATWTQMWPAPRTALWIGREAQHANARVQQEGRARVFNVSSRAGRSL
jgi:hypothetical protein